MSISCKHSRKELVTAFYNAYHRQRMRVPDEYWLKRVWSHFQGKVLEVGAGKLLWRPDPLSDYIAIDISTEAVYYAVRSGVKALLADGECIPFRDKVFDLVACHDVLEHIVNPELLLAEMCRVSRKRVLIAGPNYVGNDYAPGLDRYLPLRVVAFLLGPGRGWHPIKELHLSFDEEWEPDKDAVSAANSWWVAQHLRRHGFRVIILETWPKRFHFLNGLPVLQHIGPFMFIVGERSG